MYSMLYETNLGLQNFLFRTLPTPHYSPGSGLTINLPINKCNIQFIFSVLMANETTYHRIYIAPSLSPKNVRTLICRRGPLITVLITVVGTGIVWALLSRVLLRWIRWGLLSRMM